MTKEQKRALRRIDDKIDKAKAARNMVKVMQLAAERRQILEQRRTEERMTMQEALKDYTPKERHEATTEVIYAVATADILYGAVMDVESRMRNKYGIDELPICKRLKQLVQELHNIVKTIDDTGSDYFSSYYADVVYEIETKYEMTLKNFIYNEIQKAENKRHAQ